MLTRAATGVGPDAEAAIAKLTRERNEYKDALAKAEAKLGDEPGEVKKLMTQLKGARTRIKNLTAESDRYWRAAQAKPTVITRSDLRKLQRFFHPDRAKNPPTEKELTEASQILNGREWTVIDKPKA